ncbi:hypothetical protein G210_2313, partial [Candida maltosa Xu316]
MVFEINQAPYHDHTSFVNGCHNLMQIFQNIDGMIMENPSLEDHFIDVIRDNRLVHILNKLVIASLNNPQLSSPSRETSDQFSLSDLIESVYDYSIKYKIVIPDHMTIDLLEVLQSVQCRHDIGARSIVLSKAYPGVSIFNFLLYELESNQGDWDVMMSIKDMGYLLDNFKHVYYVTREEDSRQIKSVIKRFLKVVIPDSSQNQEVMKIVPAYNEIFGSLDTDDDEGDLEYSQKENFKASWIDQVFGDSEEQPKEEVDAKQLSPDQQISESQTSGSISPSKFKIRRPHWFKLPHHNKDGKKWRFFVHA